MLKLLNETEKVNCFRHAWQFCLKSHSNNETIIKIVGYFSVNRLIDLLTNRFSPLDVDMVHLQLQAALFLHIPVSRLFLIYSLKPCVLGYHKDCFLDGVRLHLSSHLLSILRACHIPLLFIISIPHSPLSGCIRALSIPCGCEPSREAHFLILELPKPQRVTGPGRPTRAQQTQPPSCLQEVDSKPFVFGFYKRKFCRGLPGRSD